MLDCLAETLCVCADFPVTLQLGRERLQPGWKKRTTGSAGPPPLNQRLQIPLPGSAEGGSLAYLSTLPTECVRPGIS